MTIVYNKLFGPTLLITSAAIIYTVPASPTTSLLRNGRVQLTNTSSAAVAATMYAVPSAGTPTVTNEILPVVSIGPNQTLPVDLPQMSAGDTVQALAGTAGAINIQALDGVIQS